VVPSPDRHALQHAADSDLALGVQGGASGDVLADLVQDLPAAVGGQLPEFGLEVLEVAVDQGGKSSLDVWSSPS